MLRLVEDEREKAEAQKLFSENLIRAWKYSERRYVVWRPDSIELDVHHNHNFWFASVAHTKESRRTWNSIGKYTDANGLQITVEVNIPMESNNARVSGFFARDDVSQEVCLMHDGGVGGGRLGIGRDRFLAWSSAQPEAVVDSKGNIRYGIIVTPVRSKIIGDYVERFAQTVFTFKAGVASGEITSNDSADSDTNYSDYFKEFSGTKVGKRVREFEYISRHGDIVHSLQEWRKSKVLSEVKIQNEYLVKNKYIDLGVLNREKKLIELYEVKTNADRQSLYTAIGQIGVHGSVSSETLKRYIVLPNREKISLDIKQALEKLNIKLIWFEMDTNKVTILE